MPPVWSLHLRYLLRHPWQGGLAIIGIALGVAVVVAIQIAQRSAREAFDASFTRMSGGLTHRIEAPDGVLPETWYRELCLTFPELQATPVLDLRIRAAESPRSWVRWLGVEPFSALHAGSSLLPGDLRIASARGPRAVASSATVKRHAGHSTGVAHFRYGTRRFALTLEESKGDLTPAQPLPDDLLISDIALVQDATGVRGTISYVNLRLPATAEGRRQLSRIRAFTGSRYVLTDLDRARDLRRELSRAFETNLTALSLLGLLVGMFLVYNTETFLVVQRQPLYARLRAIGVSRRELAAGVLFEAACLGALASALGILLGVLLAKSLLGLVARTVSNFYYALEQVPLALPSSVLATGWLAGAIVTLMAAIPAAAGAADTPLLRKTASRVFESRRMPTGALLQSLLMLTVGAVLHALNPGNLWLDFLVLIAGLLAVARLIPPGLRLFSAWLATKTARPGCWPEQIGIESVRAREARTGVAAAALCLAASVSLGMLLMTSSFRAAVDDWLGNLLVADAYVSVPPPTPSEVAEGALLALKSRLQGVPQLAATSSVMRRETVSGTGIVPLSVYDLPPRAHGGFRFLRGDPPAVWSRWEQEDVVILSEAYAFRHGRDVGDSLELRAPGGPRMFEIVGIVRDYASERGMVAMSASTFGRHWPTRGLSGVGLYFAHGSTLAEIRALVAELADPDVPLEIRARQEIRALSLGVFDQTFAITRVLGAIALGVSLVGIAGALLAQQLERSREYSILRALGSDRQQIFRVVLTQTLLIGTAAATLAVPTGIAIAAYLVHVVNRHAFGWSMPLHLSPDVMAGTWAGVVTAAAVAAIHPALRAVRMAPARALRYE